MAKAIARRGEKKGAKTPLKASKKQPVKTKTAPKKAAPKAAPSKKKAVAPISKKKAVVSVKAKVSARKAVQVKKPVAKVAKVIKKPTATAKKPMFPPKIKLKASGIQVMASIKQAAPAPAEMPKKKLAYNPGEFVVYPTHGVGRISEIESKKVAGQDLELVVVHFDKSRMTLRVPVEKARMTLRKISDRSILTGALSILSQKPKVKKAMWSRRQQEYETKINSGDPKLLAEVIRDLHKRHQMADQSYTERQIYETAFERLAHEIAAADKTDPNNAGDKIRKILSQPM